MAIIRITKEENDRIMTPERIAEETRRARSMPITFDEDCPELTPEQLKHFKRRYPKPNIA